MAAKTKFSLKGNEKDLYLELILVFPLASVRSEDHFHAAPKVMDRLLAKPTLDEGERLYLDALSDFVATYEDDHYPIEPASDADLLRHLLEAKGVSQADLHRETGIPKSTVSEIVGGKKPFSRQIIRKLADYFQVDVSLLTANL